MMDFPELPDFLRIPQADRNALWRGRKLTKPKKWVAPPKDEDPSTRRFRREMEKQAADKKAAAIVRLRENYKTRPRKRKRKG
jgi:hypothetical protein